MAGVIWQEDEPGSFWGEAIVRPRGWELTVEPTLVPGTFKWRIVAPRRKRRWMGIGLKTPEAAKKECEKFLKEVRG